MDLLDLMQWPAMAITIGASWLIASSHPARRNAGFWLFLLSNVLWVAWVCMRVRRPWSCRSFAWRP